MTQGIDISTWQRNVDFKKLKAAGISFVIIRAGFGKYLSQKDNMFESHYSAAKAAGLDVGAYWYSYADTAADAKTEAKVCIEAIKGKKFEYPIFFDLEERKQFNKGRSFCDSLVTAFCGTMEAAGYYSGLYISRSPLQSYISSSVAQRYALWVAEYGSRLNYSGKYGMWQNSSTLRANGYSGNLDHDYCYIDYPTAIKAAGKNGYSKPAAAKALDTEGFKKGDKGLGVYALKRRLISLGFSMNDDKGFGSGTEKAVNAKLKEWGCKPNGIAGEKFIKKIMK